MNVRRLFWQAAAILLSLAALIAITGILAGSFGDTQVRILFTVGVAFVTASTVWPASRASIGASCAGRLGRDRRWRGCIPLLDVRDLGRA